MSTIEELSGKIEKIEKEQRSKWRFFYQYLVAPILLLVIGFFLNQNLEKAKQEFEMLQLEVKKIEAAQDMLTEIFSDVPERAFIADRLMSKLLDENLSKEISEIVERYYSQKLEQPLLNQSLQDVEEIVSAADAIGGRAAESIKNKLQQNLYYVVIASIVPQKRQEAIDSARRLKEKGYDSEVHYSSSGYYAVTIGHIPLMEAKTLREKAIEKNDAPPDAYLIPGTKFIEKIFP